MQGGSSAIPDPLKKMRGRIKIILIGGVALVAVLLAGPYFIKNNEFLNDQYDKVVTLKEGYFTTENLNQLGQEYVTTVTNEQGEPEPPVGMPRVNGSQITEQPLEVSTTDQGDENVLAAEQKAEEKASIPLTPDSEILPAATIPDRFDDSTFTILFERPEKFAGYEASFSGRVYATSGDGDSDTMIFRMHNAKDLGDQYRSAIFYQGQREIISNLNLLTNDCVMLDGTARGVSLPDKTSLGVPIMIPVIDATDVKEISCVDYDYPAEKTMWSSEPQTINGITIRLDKIQFSQEHTRIQIHVANERTGGNNLYLRDSESIAMQGGHMYQSLSDKPKYVEYRIDKVLEPESEMTGFLFFEALDDISDPITFKITVEEVMITGSADSEFLITI